MWEIVKEGYRWVVVIAYWSGSCHSKTCVKRPLKNNKTKIFITNWSLMKVESIAECSPWSILQYFWPALSDNWSWNPIFRLFESGSFTQVLLYVGKYCDQSISVIHHGASQQSSLYNTLTTGWNVSKLQKNDSWVAPFQNCSNIFIPWDF